MQFIKLTQADGKSAMISPGAVQFLESVTQTEREGGVPENAFTGVWAYVEGTDKCQLMLVTDKFGYLQRLIGTAGRIQLSGKNGKRFSVPSPSIQHAREVIVDGKDHMTMVKTHIRNDNGQIAFYVTETVEEIMDILGVAPQEELEQDLFAEGDRRLDLSTADGEDADNKRVSIRKRTPTQE